MAYELDSENPAPIGGNNISGSLGALDLGKSPPASPPFKFACENTPPISFFEFVRRRDNLRDRILGAINLAKKAASIGKHFIGALSFVYETGDGMQLWRLRNEMIKMATALGPEKLRPFLIEPLFPPASFRREIDPWMLRRLGFEFVVKMLPKEFVRRLIGSEAAEAHFTNLGKFLRRNGKDLQTKDPGFKQLVERQRTLRRLKPEQMPE